MLKGIDGLEPDATSDFSFLLGDTNSRFNRKFSDHIKQLKKSPALVAEYDQLTSHLRDGYYPGYQEGEIKFMPTYKLDTEIWDEYIGEEEQCPSYTDRILFKNNTNCTMQITEYGNYPKFTGSDHRPVYLKMKITTKPCDYINPRTLLDPTVPV